MTPPVGSIEYYWDLVAHSLLPILGGAVAGTIPLSLASFALGLLLAILVAMMRISKNSLARRRGADLRVDHPRHAAARAAVRGVLRTAHASVCCSTRGRAPSSRCR